MEGGGNGECSTYIITALLQLMQKKAFDRISITELCRKAGVSRMSFYRNFESKEAVLKKWCARITDRFVAESGINYRNNTMKEYFNTLFRIVKDDIDRVFFETYRDVYDEYKMHFITGGIFNAYVLWIENGLRETPEELSLKLSEILEK